MSLTRITVSAFRLPAMIATSRPPCPRLGTQLVEVPARVSFELGHA